MTHTQPQRTWSRELAEEGLPQKMVMNHPNLVWQFLAQVKIHQDLIDHRKLGCKVKKKKHLKSGQSVETTERPGSMTPKGCAVVIAFCMRKSPSSLDIPRKKTRMSRIKQFSCHPLASACIPTWGSTCLAPKKWMVWYQKYRPVGVAGTSAASSSNLTGSTKAEERTVGRADLSWSNKACRVFHSHVHIMYSCI